MGGQELVRVENILEGKDYGGTLLVEVCKASFLLSEINQHDQCVSHNK